MRKLNCKFIRKISFVGFILTIFLWQSPAFSGNGGEPQDGKTVNFFDTEQKPTLIKKPRITYPKAAMKLGIEGTVIVSLIIDEEGKIESARILKSVRMLDNAALEAAKKMLFKPGKIKNKTVKVRMNFPFRFKLK